jgi:subtilisin family serine protease
MGLYIVRPRTAAAAQPVGLISKVFTADKRKLQIDEVLSVRQSDPIGQNIRSWLADAEQHGVKRVSQHESDTAVTGTTVVDMSDEEAERLRRELPDALVLRDRPIELIRPQKTTAAAKKKLTSTDVWHLRAIGLQAARKKGFKGTGKNVTIAVLDTGVDETHPELSGRMAGAYTFDVNQWTAHRQESSRDTDGHGTHVAGLVCGKKVGVAPGAKVVSGVMIPGGFGNLSDFILALEWAAQQPEVQIVNMSAGIPGYLPEMRVAVADLMAVGVLPVFAVGNEGRNRTRSPGNYIEVVSVGATNRANRVSGFSGGGRLVAENHQYTVPDLVAPGEGVYSCIMGGGYEAWNGTSMATPIVSGIAALMLEKHPDITVPDLIDELLQTCKDLGQPAERQGEGLARVRM